MDQSKLDDNGLFLSVELALDYVNEMPSNIKEKVKEYFHNIGEEIEHFGGKFDVGHDGQFFYVLTIDGVMSEKNY
jgi:hypothetical protein